MSFVLGPFKYRPNAPTLLSSSRAKVVPLRLEGDRFLGKRQENLIRIREGNAGSRTSYESEPKEASENWKGRPRPKLGDWT